MDMFALADIPGSVVGGWLRDDTNLHNPDIIREEGAVKLGTGQRCAPQP